MKTHNSKVIETAPDYAKAIGIALVVFGHALRGLINSGIITPSPFWDMVDSSIYLFHMPLFFYLSGLFFEQQVSRLGTGGFIKKIFYLLIVPMIIWSYLQFTLQYMAGDNANNAMDIESVLTAPFPPKQQFWFLAALFIIMSMSAVALKAVTLHRFLIGGIIACVAIRLFANDDLLFLAQYSYTTHILAQVIMNYPFFAMGVLLGPQALKTLRANTLLCLSVFAACLYINHIYDGMAVITMALAALCILSVYKTCLNIERSIDSNNHFSKMAVFIGMNSMIIYLAHVIASGGIRTILLKIGVTSPDIHLSAGTVAGLALPLILVAVSKKIEKYAPRIVNAAFPVRYKRT